MEIKYIIIAAVILGLLVLILLPGGAPAEQSLSCGSDKQCMVSALSNCTKANYTGNESGVVSFIRIEGIENGQCRVFIANVATPIITGLTGTNMTCLLPLGAADLAKLDYASLCTGSTVDYAKRLAEETVKGNEHYLKYGYLCTARSFANSSDFSYEITGPVTIQGMDMCHATVKTTIAEVGTISLDYYFNKTTDGMQPSFQRSAEASCSSAEKRTAESEFIGYFKAAENKDINGTMTCRHRAELIPVGPPIITIDTYSQPGGYIGVLVVTERGNSYSYEYSD